MGRIKKILFMRHANTKKAREKKELEDKNKDDLPIVDDAYDLENNKAVETVFRKLIENAKEINYNKNSLGSYKITQFFTLVNNINKATGDQQSDSESDNTMEISKTDKVKYVSVIHYIQLLQHDLSKMEASRVVATIHNGEVSLKVANYLRSTKFKVNPRLVKQYFENNILPELYINQAQTISLITAWHWIKKMGFYYKRYQKGIYVDGHEREDMIAYCKVFLQNIAEYNKLMPKWTDVDCKVYEELYLLSSEQKHILITHDKCTFHSYD
ncbi:37493_t:CDS:2, partial [Gigaspora margarita]